MVKESCGALDMIHNDIEKSSHSLVKKNG